MGCKYVFFDVDGTLVSHREGGRVPPATRRAVELLRQNGHVPAIATARSVFLTRGVAEELGIGLLVCCCGAQILDGAEVLAETWLSEEALCLFRDVVSEGFTRATALDDRHVYTDNEDEDIRVYLERQAGYPCVRPVSELRRAFLLYSFLPDEPDSPLFRGTAQGIVLDRTRHFVEARPAGTSKWRGIQEAARRLGFEPADVIAFGDGANDVDMLRGASVGVAVGGAPDAVKDAADFVADDIESGGILRACAALGLIEDNGICAEK